MAFRHAGNHALRAKIALNLDRYIEASRRQKTVLIHEIILSIAKEGGRFLLHEKEGNRWYDGGIDAAKNRVGAAMRDASVPGKVKCINVMKASIQSTALLSRCPSPLLSTIASQLDRRPWSPSAETYPMTLATKYGGNPSSDYRPPLFRIDCFEPDPLELDDDDESTLSAARSILRSMGCCSDDESVSNNMLDDIYDIGDSSQASEYSLRLQFQEQMSEEG